MSFKHLTEVLLTRTGREGGAHCGSRESGLIKFSKELIIDLKWKLPRKENTGTLPLTLFKCL